LFKIQMRNQSAMPALIGSGESNAARFSGRIPQPEMDNARHRLADHIAALIPIMKAPAVRRVATRVIAMLNSPVSISSKADESSLIVVSVSFKGKPLGKLPLDHGDAVALAAYARANRCSILQMLERCVQHATRDGYAVRCP
jgi:hypothetical protein